MCGIVYAHDFTGGAVNGGILSQYQLQRHRGSEGFGLYDGSEFHLVREKKEKKILSWLKRYQSDLILFHHRYPTSTVNVRRAAHPFSTKDFFGDKQYILVHNGVLYNDDVLKKRHEELGITYQSQLQDGTYNDSEALLWDVALYLEGQQEYLTAYGSIAFICLVKTKEGLETMYFGRNSGNPLKLFRSQQGIALSSEGNGDMIAMDTLYKFDYATQELTQRYLEIPEWGYQSNNACGMYNWNKPKTYTRDDLKRWDGSRQSDGTKPWDGSSFSPRNLPGAPVPVKSNELTRALAKSNPELMQNFIDYDKDGNPIFDFNPDDYYDEQGHPKGDLQPDFADVLDVALDYLDQANGRFQVALDIAEYDYNGLADEPLDKDILKDMVLLEEVQKYLCSQPDYLKGNEVSGLWQIARQQEFAL